MRPPAAASSASIATYDGSNGSRRAVELNPTLQPAFAVSDDVSSLSKRSDVITFAICYNSYWFCELTLPRWKQYAALHGHDFIEVRRPPAVGSLQIANWDKASITLQLLFVGYSLVLYVDCDMILLNPHDSVHTITSRWSRAQALTLGPQCSFPPTRPMNMQVPQQPSTPDAVPLPGSSVVARHPVKQPSRQCSRNSSSTPRTTVHVALVGLSRHLSVHCAPVCSFCATVHAASRSWKKWPNSPILATWPRAEGI